MTAPYDLITSRDATAFPFRSIESVPRCFAVDWREEDESIVAKFLQCAGLPPEDAVVRWELSKPYALLVHQGVTHDVRRDGRSAQDVMIRALSRLYGDAHEIRHLSHVAHGDTAFFVVESPATWAKLEAEHPLVRWFFTPIDRLPDLIEGTFDEQDEAARRYAEGLA